MVVAVDAERDASNVVYLRKKIEMETLEVIFKRQILKCAKALSPTEAKIKIHSIGSNVAELIDCEEIRFKATINGNPNNSDISLIFFVLMDTYL